jgi:hypothetical protein
MLIKTILTVFPYLPPFSLPTVAYVSLSDSLVSTPLPDICTMRLVFLLVSIFHCILTAQSTPTATPLQLSPLTPISIFAYNQHPRPCARRAPVSPVPLRTYV